MTTKEFTKQQRQAITAIKEGESILLEAVAGSGKTYTLTHALREIPPNRQVIAIAFNKIIADELRAKLPTRINCSTLNSLGYRIWRAKHPRCKVFSGKLRTIAKEFATAYIKRDEQKIFISNLIKVISHIRAEALVLESQQSDTFIKTESLTESKLNHICLSLNINSDMMWEAVNFTLIKAYQTSPKQIDFDEQIYLSAIFASPEHYPPTDTVAVDEAQDLSQMQHKLLTRLEPRQFIAVGDRHQAIYAWRGAMNDSLDLLVERFSLTTYPLTESFRCPQAVIEQAQVYVPHITTSKQGGTIISWGDNDSWGLRDFNSRGCIIARTNAPLFRLAFTFIKYGIPCYLPARDLVSSLRLVTKRWRVDLSLKDALEHWYNKELGKLKPSHHMTRAKLEDTYEIFKAIIISTSPVTITEMLNELDNLVYTKPSSDAIELSSIHKAKGKEWDIVYFLNPQDVPIRFVYNIPEGEEREEALQQEYNLKYVAITRSLNELIYFEYDSKKPILERRP